MDLALPAWRDRKGEIFWQAQRLRTVEKYYYITGDYRDSDSDNEQTAEYTEPTRGRPLHAPAEARLDFDLAEKRVSVELEAQSPHFKSIAGVVSTTKLVVVDPAIAKAVHVGHD